MLQEPEVRRTSPRGQLAFFLLLAALLIFYVKWDPYAHKFAQVAVQHTLGASIVTGRANHAPPVSWQAAFGYALAYFAAIWQALLAGLILGSGVEVLVPKDWLWRLFGQVSGRSAFLAGLAAVPSMMCTCCAAPLAVGLARRQVPLGAILAYWLGNPVLNPATIVFMGFVLGWGWAALRIAVGVPLVALAAYLGNRYQRSVEVPIHRSAWSADEKRSQPLLLAWAKSFFRLTIGLLPEYLALVLALGAARAFLFPAMTPAIGGSFLLFLFLAIAGTVFVIPTAGEVPILKTLMEYGLGPLGAGALMITLPAVSLPSLAMVARALPWRLLLQLSLLVVAAGCFSGALAFLLHL